MTIYDNTNEDLDEFEREEKDWEECRVMFISFGAGLALAGLILYFN